MATEKLLVVISGDSKKLITELNKSSSSVKKFADTSGKATKKTGGFGKSLGGVTSALGKAGIVAAAVGATAAIAKYGFEAAKIGAAQARLETATDNLGRQFGLTADQIVSSIQHASGNTISQYDAMGAANAAMMFGVASSTEQFTQLTQVAVTLGRAMGQDAGKSMEDLTLALGRQSPLILDNLGIIIDLDQAYRNYAITQDTTVAALTEQEKKQIFVNAALEAGTQKVAQLGGVQEDTSAKLERLNVTTDDFIAKMGQSEVVVGATELALNFANEAVTLLGDTLFGSVNATDRMAGASEDLAGAFDDQARSQEDVVEVTLEQEKRQRDLTGAMSDFFNQLDERSQESLDSERDFVTELVNLRNEKVQKEREIEEQKAADLLETEERFKEARIEQATALARGLASASQGEVEIRNQTLAETRAAIEQEAAEESALQDKRATEKITKLEQERIESQAIREQEAEERKVLAAFTNLEIEGELDNFTETQGMKGREAAEAYKAGLLEPSQELLGALAVQFGEIGTLDTERLVQQRQNHAAITKLLGGEEAALNQVVAAYELRNRRIEQFGDTSSIPTVSVGDFGRGARRASRQFGGPLFGGQPSIVGERGAEMFTPSVAGNVQPINNTTNNNMNLTINSQARTEQVEQSFRMMQAIL